MSKKLLGEVLNEEQYQSLNSDVVSKLEIYLQSKTACITDLQGEIEKIKADYEQRCYELDKKLIESSTRLDNESLQHAAIANRFSLTETELKEVMSKKETLESSLYDLEQENVSLKRIKAMWTEEKLNLQHIIEKRDLEIAKLNDEWKTVSQRLAEVTTAKNELQLKFDEQSSSEVTALYHTKRIEQEKELLTQQNASLSEEINQKSNQLMLYQKQKENELISVRSQLELTSNENKFLKESNQSLKQTATDLHVKLNELQEKMNKSAEDHHNIEEMHRGELRSQTRLAELYKSSADEAEKKTEELISAVEELQTLVRSSAENNNALQAKLEQAKKEVSGKSQQIEKLKKELEHANDLLEASKKRELSDEQLSRLCPTAAMTSKFIKSGLTLTQLYSQFVEQGDELVVAKEENKRLNEAMDSILEELNAKAPLLKRQREDYERALVTITQLTSQTDEAAMQYQQVRQEADDALRRCAHLGRENEKMMKENADLSKQVCFLLKEVEEMRGRQIAMSPQTRSARSSLVVNEDGSCNDVSSSSELITSTLVTFKDIAELQEQNQKLLAVIRRLSGDQEEAEKQEVDPKKLALQKELESANDELERLREDRARQITMVEAIVRQRDMYRVLLAQNSQANLPLSVLANPSAFSDQKDLNSSMFSTGSVASTPVKRPGSQTRSPQSAGLTSNESAKKALVELQEEFSEYKKDVQENIKILNDKVEDLKEQSSQQRTTCAKLEAQLDFAKERCEMMKQSAESAKKEADALRARNMQLYTIAQRHERSVADLNADLKSSQELVCKLQARVDGLKSELDIGKRAEERLTTENASLLREQRNQNLLLNNVQEMQQKIENQAFEVRSQLHTRIEAQDREIASLRKYSQQTAQSKQDAVQALEKQLYAVQQMYDAEKSRCSSITKELDDAKIQINNLEVENRKAEAKLENVEERLNKIGNEDEEGRSTASEAEETPARFKRALREKQDEIASLEARIEKAKGHVDHYKEVAAAAEESLKQSNEATKELMTSLQSRLDESYKHQTNLEQQIVVLEEENLSLKNEKYKVTGEVEKQTADLRRQLTAVQSELDGALRRAQDAVKNEQIAREDLKQQVAKAEESNDNYQREMILHSSAVQELLLLKDKVRSNDEEVEKLKLEKRSVLEELHEKTESWRKVEEKLKTENDKQRSRIADIEEQNNLLHEQIQKLSSQLVDVQSKKSSSPETSPFKLFKSRDPVAMANSAASGDQTDKSSEQLMDVIKFLRREKEISDTKCELVQSENIRIKEQLLQLTHQLKDIQDSLATELAKVEELTGKQAQVEALERELADMETVKTDNRALREERERMSKELRESSARYARLQEELGPLQTKNREMSAQCVALQHEKKALGEEAERWKERVQQMTQSPRRQDPEEYRRLLQEKSALATTIDGLNKEMSELKSESSALKGQIRTLDSNLQSARATISSFEQTNAAKDEEIKKLKAEMDDKVQTLNKIRRVGRRFKVQYEELLAKTQKDAASKAADAEQAGGESSMSEASSEQNSNEALKKAEADAAQALEDKARMQAELSAASGENKTLKEEKARIEKQLNDRNAEHSELMGENQALRAQLQKMSSAADENKKKLDEMMEKGQRFSKLLTSAKTQIEKLRKDNEEGQKEREKLHEDIKAEVDMRVDLQNKVEDLQRQLQEGRTAPPTQESTSVRKAANIRPTSRVNQVTPLRVTRTARVMPEPQQDNQDVERPGPSSMGQMASSSTQPAVAVSVSPIVPSSHTTVFVQPMSPARQQQHVVSSGTQSPSSQPPQVTSQASQEPSIRSSEVSPSGAGNDSDQAIVSSSDDQSTHDEPPTPATGAQPSSSVAASSRPTLPTEPSSSSGRFAAGASSSTQTTVSVQPSTRMSQQGQKRAHDQGDDAVTPSRSAATGAGSRDTLISLAPAPKRQRGSPDQSSDSVPAVTPSSDSRSESQSPATSEAASSQARVPDQSQQADDNDEHVDQSTSEVLRVHQEDECSLLGADSGMGSVEANNSQVASSSLPEEASPTLDQVASSSMADQHDVIVVSSESDMEPDDVIDSQDDNGLNTVGEDEGDDADRDMPGDESKHEKVMSSTSARQEEAGPSRPVQRTSIPNPPFIILQAARQSTRPAPLTPGIVPPSMSDPDGDSIVPCTPTLVPNRPDDSCQAINSPRVPPGQPIRFQFDDVPTGGNFGAVPGGLGSVDNTLMDLAGAGEDNARNVPTAPVPSSSTVFSSVEMSDPPQSTSNVSAVSSTIGPQSDEQETEDADHDRSQKEASSIPSNTQGRRIRIIGAPRSRGRGANSPSTSSQP